jgi:cobalt transporter subunit CbtB
MSDVVASSPSLPGVVQPPAISLREIWPWALFAFALLALVYMVGFEQGATSLTSGNVLHEWVHDGRHLLGFPCH